MSKETFMEVIGEMRVEWDVPIVVRDGAVLRADVFGPIEPGEYPVLLTHGPYGKGLSFQKGFPGMWKVLEARHPDALEGSSNRFQVWETPDPEKWVPHGYVCVRVDSRGAGRSPGFVDIYSAQEAEDFYDCIEWAGAQGWSNGRVGLLGVSYYAMNQWQVAALKPPHLAAICPWEGSADYYREFLRHGGILSSFYESWYPATILRVQHGLGERGEINEHTGELVSGPQTLTEAQLRENRPDYLADIRSRPLLDDYHRSRTPDLSAVDVPLLSAGNWAHHLHSRGNFAGFAESSSAQKWLEVHGLEHWVHFYTDYGVSMQRQFFDHFLKGADNGWDQRPRVVLNLRHVDGTFEERTGETWPLEGTEWLEYFLSADTNTLTPSRAESAASAIVPSSSSGLTFTTSPLAHDAEITGTLSARLFIESEASDVDVFVTVRVLDDQGGDVALRSALDPRGVITVGWLRASHRAIDASASTPDRPVHPHDHEVALTPGEVVELNIEIWPTSIIIPRGHRLGITLTGRDFAFEGDGPWPELYGIPMRGQAIFLHDDPSDRDPAVFERPFRIHTGGERASSVLLPLSPRPQAGSRDR